MPILINTTVLSNLAVVNRLDLLTFYSRSGKMPDIITNALEE